MSLAGSPADSEDGQPVSLVGLYGPWLIPEYTPWTPCEAVDHAGAEINP